MILNVKHVLKKENVLPVNQPKNCITVLVLITVQLDFIMIPHQAKMSAPHVNKIVINALILQHVLNVKMVII